MCITQDQLDAIMPAARAANRAAAWVAPLNDAFARFEIDSRARRAMFLGNMAVESGELSASEENLRYTAPRLRQVFPGLFANHPQKADEIAAAGPQAIANFIYDDANRPPGARLGNTRPGDGWLYRGRGPLQITGRANYAAFFRSVGMPEESDPDFLLTPTGGATASAFYWQSHGCNALADAGDFPACVARINPARQDFARRVGYYSAAMQVLDERPARFLLAAKSNHPGVLS